MNLHDALTQKVLACELAVASQESKLSDAKRLLAIAEANLIDAMIDGRVPTRFDANGQRWRLDTSTFVRPAAGCTPQVVEWIVAHGGADLVKPSMHAASRDKFLREVLLDTHGEASVPAELVGVVDVESIPKVRKARI